VILAGGGLAAAPTATLVRYSFDDGDLATGPDTFAVFEKAKGRVHLSSAFRYSGYRSVEIRDVAEDGNFPELQGYFPLRETGTLYAHFALLMADPSEQLNVALAGPAWFTFHKGGIAFWLQTRGGNLHHYSDGIPMRLMPVRAFTWYLVDVAYDVAAGTYDLTVREEGRPEPLAAVTAQSNANGQPGSAVDKFSFIGDHGHDTSNVDYFVDDVLLTVDRPIDLAPFAAPGRRKLFFDTWNDSLKLLKAKPACLPATDLSDFGLTGEDLESLRREGLLPMLQRLVGRGRTGPVPESASPASARALETVRRWAAGCSALGRGEAQAALGHFEAGLQEAPSGRIFELCAALSLAAMGRHGEAEARLAGLQAAWSDDPRLPLALAMLGLARGDLAAADIDLRQPAEKVPEDPRAESAPSSPLPEEYFFVLLWRSSYGEAGRFAARMADRLKAMGLPEAPWIERMGDAAFLAGDYRRAQRHYEEVGGGTGAPPAVLLKLSDVHHLLGDVERERAAREAIYGSLHEERAHPPDAPAQGGSR
jgi:hypothetical protein